VGIRGALEKRKSQDTRKEHKSIPAFKIAQTPRAHMKTVYAPSFGDFPGVI
jgi:hypothetical protein